MTAHPASVKSYREWLAEIVEAGHDQRRGMYRDVVDQLYNIEYIYDEYDGGTDYDRYCDGMNLRYEYKYGHRINSRCSVLEMLIALASRIDNEITGIPGTNNAQYWFWVFLFNLGLLDEDADVPGIVSAWLNRDIDRNGYGGIFPIDNAKRDQRLLSTWQQMSDYLTAYRLF